MEQIAAAGNTEIPAYLVLIRDGFEVSASPGPDDSEQWIAKNADFKLIAESPLELLGLWSMRKERGSLWKANGEEIEAFLSRFYPNQGKS